MLNPARFSVRLLALLCLPALPFAAFAQNSSTAGAHGARFDGSDAEGRAVPAGLYFVRLEADGRSATSRLVIAR